ncbi:MAG: hypothetical protein HY543_11680 [Deltaproteobacteria bacterium]|nr:hypothetical protein [Deltaproteobacteria bacterium]
MSPFTIERLGEHFQDFRMEVSERFQRVEQRLDRVEQRLDRVEQRLDRVESRLNEIMDLLKQSLQSWTSLRDTVMDHEHRLGILETSGKSL